MKTSFLILFFILTSMNLFCQDSTKSFAFKDNKARPRPNLFYQPDLSYRIWQQFNVIKEANAGDPLAQHELGIRYLLGEGVEADTVRAAEWIKKAADHGVTAAKYNYAILLINGWGVDWNPFNAFRFFNEAADEGMPEAQYALGLLYTDNLIVKRNWGKAYNWISKAAGKGIKSALETLQEIKKKVPDSKIDTTGANLSRQDTLKAADESSPIKSSLGLVYIDFEDILDTIPIVTNKRLLEDLTHSGFTELSDSIKNGMNDTNFVSIAEFIPLISEAAEYGSPEALAFLGRLYEKGIYYKKDLTTAIAYYIRAARLDNPAASILLYNMQKEGLFFPLIKEGSDAGNPSADFDWYGLEIMGLDRRITLNDAVELLKKSADNNFTPAIIEYGQFFYSGLQTQNPTKAFTLWQKAVRSGSGDAQVRMDAAVILDQLPASDYGERVERLLAASVKGSVLAQTAAGYAFENGAGVKKDIAKAVTYYRDSAQRGSRFAYQRLKDLYDSKRPENSEFKID